MVVVKSQNYVILTDFLEVIFPYCHGKRGNPGFVFVELRGSPGSGRFSKNVMILLTFSGTKTKN